MFLYQSIINVRTHKKVFFFRMAPKLTVSHLNMDCFAKMRVKPAAELLSNTVGAGLCTLVMKGNIDTVTILSNLLCRFTSCGRPTNCDVLDDHEQLV